MAEVKLKDAPKGVQTFYDKGVLAMERGNLDYAMDMFEAALQIEPRLLQVRKLFHAAAVKQKKSLPAGKLTALKTMRSLMKAQALLKKDPLRAVKMADGMLRIDPFNLKVAGVQRDAAIAANMPEIAVQTFEILREHQPDELAILIPLAQLYRDTEQFEQEYECRTHIVRLRPNDSAAQKALKDAAAHHTMGKAGWQNAESYRDLIRQDHEPSEPE
jgi:tetratricopeptide (TPR) repeat protein